ncbi:MAG: preprotein translocase subunit YajC [Acidimicrobiia bacterium]
MTTSFILAQTDGAGGGLTAFLPLLLAVGFLFLITVPQRRMRKQAAALQESLSVGDKIRTAGGIHGRILSMDDGTVLIEVEVGKLRLERRAIAAKLES